MAFSNKIILECMACHDVNEHNWKDADDDLLVCTNVACNHKDRIACRNCMDKSWHRRTGDHSNDYIDAAEWWKQNLQLDKKAKLEMIKDNKPEFKNKTKGITKGVTSVAPVVIIALKNKSIAAQTMKGLKLMRSPTVKELQGGLTTILKRLGKSAKESKEIIANATAKGGGNSGLQGLWDSLGTYSKEASSGAVCMKDLAKGQAIANFAFCLLEMGYNAVQYCYYGSISEEEMYRRNNRAIIANGASFGGGMVGAFILGAVLGPVGVVVGSAIGGYASDYYSRNWFDDQWPDKSKEFEDATKMFNFQAQSVEQILQLDSFNLKNIRKRYHQLSSYHHPDAHPDAKLSKEQKQQDWNDFYKKYCLLLTIAKQKEEKQN